MLAITVLSHSDNHILFYTLKEFFNNTVFKIGIQNGLSFDLNPKLFILIQNCSKSYSRGLESLINGFKKTHSFEYEIINQDNNLGVSGANNLLFEKTKDYEYVFHLEDDWILMTKDKFWLIQSYKMIFYKLSSEHASTIIFRKYGSDEEKYKYGWTRTIPYVCHQYKDNFNYETKKGKQLTVNNESIGTTTFHEIKDFLFTFNPHLRLNKDYIDSGVYPFPQYNDVDTDIIIKDGEKQHKAEHWGWCEALTMEKTRHLTTYMYEDGIFVHYDDWIDVLKQQKKGPFINDFEGIFNINCHVPVLYIHLNDSSTVGIKHEFLFFIHFYWHGNSNERIKELRRVFSKYSPKAIITVGENASELNRYLHYIPFEYRKKWIHFNKYHDINTEMIEYCVFTSFYKHPEQINHPVVSIITPAYESKHRIFRPLQSLLDQTYTNWEWIIIDDSKSDETWKTLTEMAEEDYRIQIYKRQKNDGSIGKNKLFCGNLARGALIFELDHDDDILPQTFERLVSAAKKYPDAGFFYSDFIECFENSLQTFNYGDHFGFGFGSYYRQWWKNDFHYMCVTPRLNPHTLRHIVGVPNHFRCWSREAYHTTSGHNSDLQVVDDYELIIRTMLKYRWVHIPEFLYVQYRNQGGDNFTFHRNALIQYLTGKVRLSYENEIHNRLIELGVEDTCHNKYPGHDKDWMINKFEYPILEYTYYHKDQDGNNPCISIVVPTYNRPNHLRRALDSIFAQTYQNFEILLVGDKCSALEEFIRSYEKAKDSRLKWYNLQNNGGPGGHLPRNYAIKMMCKTKWISYLDDDNFWIKSHLEHLVEEIRKDNELDLIFSSMMIDDKPLIFDIPRKGRIDTSCVVHKFDLCVKNGLWKDRNEAGYSHDWEFFNRISNEFTCKWKSSRKCTLVYNTEFNGQSYDQLISM